LILQQNQQLLPLLLPTLDLADERSNTSSAAATTATAAWAFERDGKRTRRGFRI
jgi:hypothetical protein